MEQVSFVLGVLSGIYLQLDYSPLKQVDMKFLPNSQKEINIIITKQHNKQDLPITQ